MSEVYKFSALTPETQYDLDNGMSVFSPEHYQSIHYAIPEGMVDIVLEQEMIHDGEHIDRVVANQPLQEATNG